MGALRGWAHLGGQSHPARSFGRVAVGDLDGRGTVWTSPDGVTWSAFPHGLDINGVTAGPSGLVAVGGYETTEIGCHAAAALCNAMSFARRHVVLACVTEIGRRRGDVRHVGR